MAGISIWDSSTKGPVCLKSNCVPYTLLEPAVNAQSSITLHLVLTCPTALLPWQKSHFRKKTLELRGFWGSWGYAGCGCASRRVTWGLASDALHCEGCILPSIRPAAWQHLCSNTVTEGCRKGEMTLLSWKQSGNCQLVQITHLAQKKTI